MIWGDVFLGATALFFFVLSFLYGWGLLRLFRHNFRWSLASVVGIASVVSCTYVFVWQVRGIGDDPLQAVWDLVVVFLAALPGMTWVDYTMKADAENGQKDRIRELLKDQREIKDLLLEVLGLLGMRSEATEYLVQFQKFHRN